MPRCWVGCSPERSRNAGGRWLVAAAVLAGLASAAVPPPTVASTPDDQARLLAGLPVAADSPLSAIEEDPAWKEHEQALREMWARLEATRLQAMREWSRVEVAARVAPDRPLLYLFGGPDFITAWSLFPSAPLYVLAGLEQVGRLPEPETLKPAALATALRAMRHSLHSEVDASFFITSKMSADLSATELKGVEPLLMLFVARTGNQVVERRPVQVLADGTLAEREGIDPDPGAVPGVEIRFRHDEHAIEQRLLYLRLDLSNKALPDKPGFLPFLSSLERPNSLLKAASFILFDSAFSETRRFLLDHSAAILQDDSGLPFHSLAKGPWSLTLFGDYTPLRYVFKSYFQHDLKQAFAATTPGPLPFRIGYAHEGPSNLVLAVRKEPRPEIIGNSAP